MIHFFLLLAGVAADPYQKVEDAFSTALHCETQYLAHNWNDPAGVREACATAWAEHANARLAYFDAHRREVRRRVSGFQPQREICWQAFEVERRRWPGMPKNTALQECKNARD